MVVSHKWRTKRWDNISYSPSITYTVEKHMFVSEGITHLMDDIGWVIFIRCFIYDVNVYLVFCVMSRVCLYSETGGDALRIHMLVPSRSMSGTVQPISMRHQAPELRSNALVSHTKQWVKQGKYKGMSWSMWIVIYEQKLRGCDHHIRTVYIHWTHCQMTLPFSMNAVLLVTRLSQCSTNVVELAVKSQALLRWTWSVANWR